MTDYTPPLEDLPIFDSSVFNVAEVPLTQASADKRYLRYPNAQGTENLQAIVVNGTASFNATSVGSVVSNATQPAPNDSSTNVPTTAWVQSAISAIPPPPVIINQTLNSLTINPNPNPGAVSSTGIYNQFNAGALYSLYSGGNSAYGSNYTPTRPLNIRFITNSGGAVPTWSGFITLEVNFWFSTGSAVGQTTCTLQILAPATRSNWGAFGGTIYNINNKINGDDNYYYTDPTYSPNGRQYYTYNQTFSGVSGANAYLSGVAGSGIYTVQIYFQMPAVATYSYNCKIIDVSALSGYNTGVEIFS